MIALRTTFLNIFFVFLLPHIIMLSILFRFLYDGMSGDEEHNDKKNFLIGSRAFESVIDRQL